MFSSHLFLTSSSLDVPAGVTQEGHTGFLIHLLSAVRALIFLARRVQPFLSLVDREVEFCVPSIRVNRVGEEDEDHVYAPTAYTADDGANRSSRANLQTGTILHLPRGRRDRNPGYVR